MNNIFKHFVVLLLIAGISSGCDNYLSPSVDQNKPTETVVQDAADLQSVVEGGYDYLNQFEVFGRDFYVSGDVMADNAFSNGNSGRFVTQDQVIYTPNSTYASDAWETLYEVVGVANLAIGTEMDSSPEVDQVKGEAYAMRAFSHFNLLLAFGQQYVDGSNLGIPYITSYANEDNFNPSRNTVDEVWANIESDLEQAVSLLNPEVQSSTKLDYWSARALQTRYYLYTEQYDQVVTVAEDVINNSGFEVTAAEDLVSTWQSGTGPQSLFELAFTDADRLGIDNIARIYRPTNYGDVEVSEDLYTAHADDDVRLGLYGEPGETVVTLLGPVEIEGYRMLNKYTDENGSDNVRLIRFAEVVLNYAEALARGASGEMTAVEALNLLAAERYENGSPYSGSVSVDDVLLERRLELAMEGQRLYDLLRTGQDIAVGDDGSYRSSTIPYGNYRVALPIPDDEIRANSNIDQNEGY